MACGEIEKCYNHVCLINNSAHWNDSRFFATVQSKMMMKYLSQMNAYGTRHLHISPYQYRTIQLKRD